MATESAQRRTFLKPGDVNREKTCPLLLRVFHQVQRHHRAQEFDNVKNLARDEAQIYTWRDATLREITELIKALNPAARARYAQISFALVYPDKSGLMALRPVGECSGDSRSSGRDDNKTLDELHFETGDYLDVAIQVNSY